MLLGNYASDSESGSDTETPASGPSRPAPSTGPAPAPAPGKSTSTTAAKPKRKGPVKITLDLPKSGTAQKQGDGEEDEDDEEREFKRAKTGPKGGKGSSALLGMLPPPKRKLPASKSSSSTMSTSKPTTTKTALPKPAANLPAPPGHESDSDDEDDAAGRMLKAAFKKQGVKTGPSVDLFGLGDDTPSTSTSTKKTTPKPSSISISSAPAVADFIPPPPGPNDPYPGYYQLPSGQWAAYDQEYYHTFFPPAKEEEETDGDGRVGRHWEEFNAKGADFIDIDVSKGLEEARVERERRERAVKPKLPGDEVEYKAIGQIKGLATERHQLSSLLNTAFTQKEELEQRITSNKKNMRVAAQKYGF